MKVRADALASALCRLPRPHADGPTTWVVNVLECRLSVAARSPSLTDQTVDYHRLVFKREQYAEGCERWFEWTLDVNT